MPGDLPGGGAAGEGGAWCPSQDDLPGFFKGDFLGCGWRDADDYRALADAHLDFRRAGLFRGADGAGDVGLRDGGGASAHVSYRELHWLAPAVRPRRRPQATNARLHARDCRGPRWRQLAAAPGIGLGAEQAEFQRGRKPSRLP